MVEARLVEAEGRGGWKGLMLLEVGLDIVDLANRGG